MEANFTFLRPYWWLLLIPFSVFAWRLLQQKKLRHNAWAKVCSPELLPYVCQTKPQGQYYFVILCLLGSALCMIFSLAGPSWSFDRVPTFQTLQPRVIVLDLSNTMLEKDLLPNRLSRAKFKLHDLFKKHQPGQFGLVVYTGEPFVVSPLTEDSQTIDALLPMLSPDIMPVGGNKLDSALTEAQLLIEKAGFLDGHVLVLTAKSPTNVEIDAARRLHAKGIHVSILPILPESQSHNALFERFAAAGGGELLTYRSAPVDIETWLKKTQMHSKFQENNQNEVLIPRDQGRYFILGSLLLLLPVFRRNGLQRVIL